jgi:hypothetical protein
MRDAVLVGAGAVAALGYLARAESRGGGIDVEQADASDTTSTADTTIPDPVDSTDPTDTVNADRYTGDAWANVQGWVQDRRDHAGGT